MGNKEEVVETPLDLNESLGHSLNEQLFVLVEIGEESFEGEKVEETQMPFLELIEVELYLLIELVHHFGSKSFSQRVELGMVENDPQVDSMIQDLDFLALQPKELLEFPSFHSVVEVAPQNLEQSLRGKLGLQEWKEVIAHELNTLLRRVRANRLLSSQSGLCFFSSVQGIRSEFPLYKRRNQYLLVDFELLVLSQEVAISLPNLLQQIYRPSQFRNVWQVFLYLLMSSQLSILLRPHYLLQ